MNTADFVFLGFMILVPGLLVYIGLWFVAEAIRDLKEAIRNLKKEW